METSPTKQQATKASPKIGVIGAGPLPSLNKTILETALMEIDSMQTNLECMKKALTKVLDTL